MRFTEGKQMTSFIGALSLFMVITLSTEAHSVTSNVDKTVTQQLDVATYEDSIKEYRNARKIARAEIRIARTEYLTARRNADSIKAKAEAFAKFRLARAAAWDLVPKRPVRPTN
jgi:hypothetical protein